MTDTDTPASGAATEREEDRQARLRANRDERYIKRLQELVIDLSWNLTDEENVYSVDGLEKIRRRVANALPPYMRPDWLNAFADPAVVQSQEPAHD